jgi:serine/threonine protein kinase
MSKYKVVRELGRNCEGGRITYLATETSLNPPQPVVIKEFRFAAMGANWSGFKAYEREIELLRQLKHPRIPYYLNSFETKSGFCLVQEYKNAPSLAQRRSFTPEEIRQIALSVLEILVYLQRRVPPIIHRDIKPENILVDKQLNAYLVDFGFARIRGGQVALSSIAAGTPGFMPPEEQFGRPLTEASDLYSLGATLIGLLTGTRSVDIGQLIDDNYRFVFKEKVPQLSPRFVRWLTKLVEPNLKNRYPNATVALEALKPIPVVGGSNQSRTTALVAGLASLSIILLGKTWTFPKSETVVHTLENTKPNPKPSFVTPTPKSPEASSHLNRAVPFRISSMNSPFSTVGTFDGRYRVYPDFIEVTVTKATIYLLDNAPYKGRRELTSVTFGLGSDTPQGWNIVNRAQFLPVNKVMKPGDTYTFNDARFLIPKDGLTDLSKHWLIVQMETITLDGEYATGSPGYSYAHSRRTIFSNSDTTDTPLVQQLLATKKCPGCNLQNANLNDSILVGASLSQSNLEGAKLLNANLQNANLHKANLKRVYLRSSNLKGANLQGADLEGADVSNAQLQRANLKGANLEGVRLVTSNLEGANLEGANLLGAEVVENTKLTGANLKGATMPDGSLHE